MTPSPAAGAAPAPVIAVAAFYRFVALPDASALREAVLARCDDLAVRGTVLLAPEGINGTVAGSADAIAVLLAWLRAAPPFGGRLADLAVRRSTSAAMPFGRLKVRLKREIVTFGDPAADPTRRAGTRVDPQAWNALLDDPAVTLIDTRNAFEVAMGTFEGATDPRLLRFSDFRAYAQAALDPARHRRVALFCTGGIRCEKASAFLLNRGFPAVYQLEGGILRYLETMPARATRWQGTCFVFDERVALGPGLKPAESAVEVRHG